MADVRASVPGTVEAKTAALEALLPTRKSVAVGAAPDVNVTYGGEPKFEPIAGTQVSRAVNSGNDVILYDGTYYLCVRRRVVHLDVAERTVGRHRDGARRHLQDSAEFAVVSGDAGHRVGNDTDDVVYSYPPSYSTGVYVAYGVPWYGTGWYYPPYIYGPYYYPYWGASYGHGYWYSPMTGAYGSRSVWYGPYGGYSYSQGYNPSDRTIRLRRNCVGRRRLEEPQREIQPAHRRRHRNVAPLQRRRQHGAACRAPSKGPNGNAVAMERKTDFDNQTVDDEPQDVERGFVVDDAHVGWTRRHDDIRQSNDRRTAAPQPVEGEHQIGQGGNTTITGSDGGQASVDRSVGAGGTVTRDGTIQQERPDHRHARRSATATRR